MAGYGCQLYLKLCIEINISLFSHTCFSCFIFAPLVREEIIRLGYNYVCVGMWHVLCPV